MNPLAPNRLRCPVSMGAWLAPSMLRTSKLVEAGDVATTGENADALFRHGRPALKDDICSRVQAWRRSRWSGQRHRRLSHLYMETRSKPDGKEKAHADHAPDAQKPLVWPDFKAHDLAHQTSSTPRNLCLS